VSGNLFLTDYYELTCGRVNHKFDRNQEVTQTYFYRRCPYSQYMLAVGQHKFIDYVLELNEGTLTEDHIKWLERTSGGDMPEEFLDYLASFKFDGEITGVDVGTPMFPNESIINVTGKNINVQILETYLLHAMNTMSPVATEAQRLRTVAKKRSVVDFGARRSFNPMWTAEASYIGGTDGTSLVKAGYEYDMPYVGTISHAFIQSRWDGQMSFSDSELLAFREYAEVYPHNCILLVDTYNTMAGVLNAIIVARELRQKGYELKGIRLDSGDLITLSKLARIWLDETGFENVKIYLSDGINALGAKKLIRGGARADGFGCGTRLVHPPPLGGVFKLVQIGNIPYMKFTDNKAKMTIPMKRQLWRSIDFRGHANHDIQTLWDEAELALTEYKPLHRYLWRQGGPDYDFPSVKEMRTYTIGQMKMMKSFVTEVFDPKSSMKPAPYKVYKSKKLEEIIGFLVSKYKGEFPKPKNPRDDWKERMEEVLDKNEEIMTRDMSPDHR